MGRRDPNRPLKAHEAWQAALDGSLTYDDLADLFSVTRSTIAGWFRDWKTGDLKQRYEELHGATGDSTAGRPAPNVARNGDSEVYQMEPDGASGMVNFDEYEFTDVEPERYTLPRFTGYPIVEGNCIVTGDYQLPTTDWKLAELVLDVAKATGVKTLLIVGDWVNCDVLSSYDQIIPPIPLSVEIQASVRLARRYASWFDTMILALGNHEHRMVRLMKGDIGNSALGRLLGATDGKLRITPYSHIEIHSGGQVWRATHQAAYSKIKGRVGDTLAQKFQCHVITHHQHHVAKMMDSFGRYVVIDNGGIFDADKMAYVRLRDTTLPEPTKGFTVILNGTGHLITPYTAFTDLGLWLRQTAEKGQQAA